ncbi:hypothetical protein GPALN_014550 [Globodera pallida]|nr:hypothetical protein GPALN_014550 [Globodera pallida]
MTVKRGTGYNPAVQMEVPNWWDKHHPRLTYIVVLAKNQSKYFEITVIRRTGQIYIGYAPKTMQLKNAVGRYAGSYSYDDSGTIRGHTIPGCAYTDDGVPYLDTENLTVNSASKLFPCVSLHAPLDEIEANFGPNFVFQNVDDI